MVGALRSEDVGCPVSSRLPLHAGADLAIAVPVNAEHLAEGWAVDGGVGTAPVVAIQHIKELRPQRRANPAVGTEVVGLDDAGVL